MWQFFLYFTYLLYLISEVNYVPEAFFKDLSRSIQHAIVISLWIDAIPGSYPVLKMQFVLRIYCPDICATTVHS